VYREPYGAWAYATTALVYHEVIAQIPHRSRAVRESTWAPDNTGSFQYLDGKWFWIVHWTQVKNGRSNDIFIDKDTHDGELKDINMLYYHACERCGAPSMIKLLSGSLGRRTIGDKQLGAFQSDHGARFLTR
jgi:hypothetical protein